MARDIKRFDCYLQWKALGHKRRITQKLADEFGVSLQTLYNWRNKPIKIDNVMYENWEAAYKAETEIIRKNIEQEISNKLTDNYKLEDAIIDKALVKLYMQLDDEKYTVSVDDVVKLSRLKIDREAILNSISGTNTNNSNKVDVSIGFRSDKVENKL